jgi:hypothetical protein
MTGAAIAPHPVNAGSITYSIQNYPADQNGFTLSGEIVTDGKIGDLSPSDITSWTYTITSATTSNTFSGTGPAGVAITGDVVATSTQITLAQPPIPSGAVAINTLTIGPNSSNSGTNIDYARITEGTGSIETGYNSHINGTTLWIGGPTTLGGTNPWLIAAAASGAAVPEPSAAILGVIGAVSGIAYGWSRRRQAQRRQAVA